MTNPTTEDRIAQFIKIHVQMGTPFKSIAAGVIRLIETQPVSVEDERIAAMDGK